MSNSVLPAVMLSRLAIAAFLAMLPTLVQAFAVPSRQDNLIAPAQIPSCEMNGKVVRNFALNDLHGKTWGFRSERGKLTLVFFCGSWCPHCIMAMTPTDELHERFRGKGLQVVGIAYEIDAPRKSHCSHYSRLQGQGNPFSGIAGHGVQQLPSPYLFSGFSMANHLLAGW